MQTYVHKTLLIGVLVLYSFVGSTQNTTIDSLKIDSLKKILQTQKDTTKVNTLNELCSALPDSEVNNIMQYATEALSLSEKTNFKKGKGVASRNIGWIYGYQHNHSEALKNYYSALKLLEEPGDKQGSAKCLQFIGAIYFEQENYAEALKNFYASVKISEEIGNRAGIAQTYNSIGEIYLNQGNTSKALEKFSAALKIYEELGEMAPNWGIVWCYSLIGNIYEKWGDSAYSKGDKATAENNFSEALKKFRAYLEMSKKIERKDNVAFGYLALGNLYLKLKTPSTAKNYLERGLQLSKELGDKGPIRVSYQILSILDSIQGNYKNAYDHYKMYILYRDSIINQESISKSMQAKMQYEFDKKDAITKGERARIEAEQQRAKNLQYFTIASLTILVLVVLLIAFIQWRNNKQKKKANGLLTQQKEKVEGTLAELEATQGQLIQSEKMASIGKLQQAVSNERLRISRELHDEVGATLSSISIFSQAAIQKNESGNMADSKNILERIGETSREVMSELNDAVWLINPRNDNLQKIIQRISNYALPLCKTNDIHFEIKAAASVENLDLTVEKRKAIYLIIKEAVNNSLKYAAAKNLVIQFEKNHKALHISIRDDGRGFAESSSSAGNGLNNMKQRAKEVNGKINIDSVQQKGTEIILQVPLTNTGD